MKMILIWKCFWVQDWDNDIQVQNFVFELNIFDCGNENYFIIETIRWNGKKCNQMNPTIILIDFYSHGVWFTEYFHQMLEWNVWNRKSKQNGNFHSM